MRIRGWWDGMTIAGFVLLWPLAVFGVAGHDVGQILDFLVNVHLDKHSDIFLTYGHLFSGDFIRGTTPGGNRNVDYTLLQYSYRW